MLLPLLLFTSLIAAQTELKIGVVQNYASPTQQLAMALLNFTVSELNTNGSFPIPIRLLLRDSNNSISQAITQSNQLIKLGVTAIIGEWSSTNTLPLASALAPYNILQCSSATSADLSNRIEYPYFFRSVSSDLYSANAFIAMALNMKWLNIALLVNAAPFGIGLQREFVKVALTVGIKVIANQLYNSGDTNFTRQFNEFQSKQARIILLFGYDAEIPFILTEASNRGMLGPNYVYIGTNTANAAYNVLYSPGLIVTPEITRRRSLIDGLLINNANEAVNTGVFNALNARFLAATGLVPVTTNYWANDCLLALVGGFSNLLAQGTPLAQLISSPQTNFQFATFLNLTVSSPTGVLSFDQNGERQGQFLFSSITNGTRIPVALTNTSGIVTLINGGPVYAQGSLLTPSDSPHYTEIKFNLAQPGVVVLFIILTFGAIATVVSSVLTVKFRGLESVKAVSPNISLCVALGLTLSFLAPFWYIGGTVTRLQCQAHIYLQHIAITTSLSFVILKAYRIYRIFDNRPDKKKNMGDVYLIGKGILSVIVMCVIVTIGDTLSPSVPVVVVLQDTLEYYSECRAESNIPIVCILGYELALLLTANILAFKTRNAHAAYNESKYIRMAVQNVLMMNLIVRFVQYVLGDASFLIKLYIEGYVFAYSDLFLFVCLIVRPLGRAVVGSTRGGYKADSKAFVGSHMGSKVRSAVPRQTMLATGGIQAIVIYETKDNVVYLKEEGWVFSGWKTYMMTRSERGLYLSPLKYGVGGSVMIGSFSHVKGVGMFFSPDTYEIEKHERMVDTLRIIVPDKVYAVQFEKHADATLWVQSLDKIKENKEKLLKAETTRRSVTPRPKKKSDF